MQRQKQQLGVYVEATVLEATANNRTTGVVAKATAAEVTDLEQLAVQYQQQHNRLYLKIEAYSVPLLYTVFIQIFYTGKICQNET